ncbi:MAG: ATP-dependent DNA helicase RecQ [Rubrobacter sp.]|nr:ATP-dependent DNA helicase RecQ [Rubrobacter sp.]
MPHKVLKEIFGFDSFRPGQEDAILAVLEGRDTLAVMPTGGGKSLCYQVPALMQESLTVIVSPLISLMKDQIDSLIQSEVAEAAALHSGLSPEERWDVERRVRSGEIKMLYVAPERLRSLEFVLSLRRAGVGLFVVDEAHCISEWGHNFRPDYLFLPRVVRDLGSPPVLALTATATPRVRDDISRSLRMREPAVVVTSFNRPNLTYRVIEAKKKSSIAPLILEQIRKFPPPGIVYALSRKDCEEIAAELRRSGVEAAAYHAGLGSGERTAIQERFMTDELPVVVATVAFGMGVDKPNVRFVIHATVPGSLPAYIQESGRAGRDGEPSECVVLYRAADLGRRRRLITLSSSGEDEVVRFFRGMAGLEREGRVNASPAALATLGGVDADSAGIMLRSLEESGLLSRGYDLWEEVEIWSLDEEPSGLRDDVRAVHAALPGTGAVRLTELARKADVRPAVAQGAVYSMMVSGSVEAAPRGSLADVRLRATTLDDGLRRNIASRLKARAKTAYSQVDDIEGYATLSSCRRERLLWHFGDTEEVSPCAGCDVCLGEVEARETDDAPISAAVDGRRRGGTSAFPTPRPEIDEELFERLRVWRGDQARSQQVPAYVVLHNSHLEEIAARKPRTVQELGAVKGIGLRRAARYGEDLLALVRGEEGPTSEAASSEAASSEAAPPDTETREPPPYVAVSSEAVSSGGSPSEPPPETEPSATSLSGDGGEDFRVHLEAAEKLIGAGRGSDAVLELSRAIELGGGEARRAVDELLAPDGG